MVKIDGDLMGKCGCCGDYIGGIRLNEVFNGKYVFKKLMYIYWEGVVVNVMV